MDPHARRRGSARAESHPRALPARARIPARAASHPGALIAGGEAPCTAPAGAKNQQEAGSVLSLALMVALLVFGLGMAVLWLSASATRVLRRPLSLRPEALQAAQSGIDRARAILARSADWNAVLRGCGSLSDPRQGVVLCDDASGKPVPLLEVRLVDPFRRLKAPPRSSGLERIAFTVWVRNDWAAECDTGEADLSRVDCNGDGKHDATDEARARTDRNGRLIVRAEGVARDGLTVAAVEVILSRPLGSDGDTRPLPRSPRVETWREVP